MSERNGTGRQGLSGIVPERDERIGQRRTAPVNRERPASHGNGGTGGVWKVLVIVMLLAITAGGWFGWQQYQQLNTLQTNFDGLNARLASTDESLSQSGTALQLKINEQGEELKEHWAEIRKLWGISYDRNRKAIADNTKVASSNTDRLANLEKLATAVSEISKQVESDSKKIVALGGNSLAVSAEMEDIRLRLQNNADKLASVEQSLGQWRDSVGKRIAKNEEALNAIDAFRRQINQELLQLRKKLSDTGNNSDPSAPVQ